MAAGQIGTVILQQIAQTGAMIQVMMAVDHGLIRIKGLKMGQ